MPTSKSGERLTRRGEVLITKRQYILLRLLDSHPSGSVESQRAWLQLAAPVYGRSTDFLQHTIARMHPSWVRRRLSGPRIACSITRRGRDIANGRVPIWISGVGPPEAFLRTDRLGQNLARDVGVTTSLKPPTAAPRGRSGRSSSSPHRSV
jgi:hypothetical protein